MPVIFEPDYDIETLNPGAFVSLDEEDVPYEEDPKFWEKLLRE